MYLCNCFIYIYIEVYRSIYINERSDKPIRTETLRRFAKIILKENHFELGD